MSNPSRPPRRASENIPMTQPLTKLQTFIRESQYWELRTIVAELDSLGNYGRIPIRADKKLAALRNRINLVCEDLHAIRQELMAGKEN